MFQEGHAYMKKRANKNSNNAPLSHVKNSLPVFFEVHETLSGEYQSRFCCWWKIKLMYFENYFVS